MHTHAHMHINKHNHLRPHSILSLIEQVWGETLYLHFFTSPQMMLMLLEVLLLLFYIYEWFACMCLCRGTMCVPGIRRGSHTPETRVVGECG